MAQPTHKQILHASKLLDAVRSKEGTQASYDLLSDAIIWVDEVPELEGPSAVRDTYSVLRPLWWHRTRLILGQIDERFLKVWDLVRQSAPNWPGFLPERCRPDAERAAMYHARVEQWAKDMKHL